MATETEIFALEFQWGQLRVDKQLTSTHLHSVSVNKFLKQKFSVVLNNK